MRSDLPGAKDNRLQFRARSRVPRGGSFHSLHPILPDLHTGRRAAGQLPRPDIGLPELSIIVVEPSIRAATLYEKFGVRPVKRSPAASHASLHYAGNLVLMTWPV